MIEEWRDIKGYEGIYQVSNLGRVKSLSREYWHGNRWYKQKEKILRQNLCTSGYMSVMLYNAEHKHKRIMIHILVARAFIHNPDNLPMINHKDENKLNNVVYNLEWCTNQYNIEYGTGKQRWYEAMKRSGAWDSKSDEVRQKQSASMKAHIAMRKLNGTYWFNDREKGGIRNE